MTQLATTKKQRLQKLENQIRKAAEQIEKNGLEIGRDLCEIRDEELWAEDYESWNQYLKMTAQEIVGKSFSQAARLIQAAEISKKLPSSSRIDATTLTATHLNELARLAPIVGKKEGVGGSEKDLDRLRTQDVKRVLEAAVEISDNGNPSVRDVRKAVDADLGIDRAAKAEETRQQREAEATPKLETYLDVLADRLEVAAKKLAEVDVDVWKLLRRNNPKLVKRLTAECESMAAFLKETGR
jgi:hypothetical protein